MPKPPNTYVQRRFAVYSALGLLVGCQQLTPAARQQVADGTHAYNIAQYDRAKDSLTQVIDEFPEAPEIGEAHYIRGLVLLKLKRRTEARRDFQTAVERSPRREVRMRAQGALAVMAYDDNDWASGVEHYREAIDWLTDLQDYDDHLLRYGLCLQRTGRWEESAHYFAQIVHEHPKGSAAKHAREMLSWNHPYFTVQCHALSKAEAASKEVARLKAAGLKATQSLDTRGGRAFYLVQVGRYQTYDEALEALQRVRRVGGVPAARVMP